jgi:hypothetical protein
VTVRSTGVFRHASKGIVFHCPFSCRPRTRIKLWLTGAAADLDKSLDDRTLMTILFMLATRAMSAAVSISRFFKSGRHRLHDGNRLILHVTRFSLLKTL